MDKGQILLPSHGETGPFRVSGQAGIQGLAGEARDRFSRDSEEHSDGNERTRNPAFRQESRRSVSRKESRKDRKDGSSGLRDCLVNGFSY